MKNKPHIYLPIFFAVVLVLGLLLGTLLKPTLYSRNGLFYFELSNYDKVNDVIQYIENEYVDSLDKNFLIETAIQSLLQSLDPHSVYIPADEFNAMNDPLKGNFEGIGIQFRIIRDTITVINVIPGGPSETAGLKGGDRIIRIDGQNVANTGISDEETIKKLKGPGGTKVKVSVYRRGITGLNDYLITRDVIATYSLDIAYMVTKDIGYIKISRFSQTTHQEFVNALDTLLDKGMKKLILDLRGNGGGFFDAAVNITDELLKEGDLIVYTEGFHRQKETYYATSSGKFENNPLVILIDEFSASASEILAGAVQDNDRGTIIGRRSFGKGLVQDQIRLPDGSAIRLTISRYHTPTGRCIQKPYTNDVDQYYADFYKQFLEDPKFKDSMAFADTSRYITSGGKIVYGGGGIFPDIFITYSSEHFTPYYNQLSYTSLIYNFAFDYADKNRISLLRYKNAINYIHNFNITNKIFDEFVSYASQNGVKGTTVDIAASAIKIRIQLKAYIGRNIFNDDAFYPVILSDDVIFKKAVEYLAK